MPWDKDAILQSVKKNNRSLIVHEDTKTAGFGAKISTILTKEVFEYLDAPIKRLAMPDIPMPYNINLMNTVLPNVDNITQKLEEIIRF